MRFPAIGRYRAWPSHRITSFSKGNTVCGERPGQDQYSDFRDWREGGCGWRPLRRALDNRTVHILHLMWLLCSVCVCVRELQALLHFVPLSPCNCLLLVERMYTAGNTRTLTSTLHTHKLALHKHNHKLLDYHSSPYVETTYIWPCKLVLF